jgi:hypothetical protein
MPPKLDSWMSRRAKDKGVLKAINAREEALVRTQLKIMDIRPPLIELYARLASFEGTAAIETCHSVQAALRQWGRAFVHVTRKRRESVVKMVDPRVEYLLKEDNSFNTGNQARELLFTGQFLVRMLTEAHQDETLARRDQAAAAVERRNPVRSTRRDQHFLPPPRPSPYGERQPSERIGRARGRRGVGDSRGGRGRGNPNPRRYDLSLTLMSSPGILSTPDVVEIGARLSLFADRWSKVTDDPWVLDTVTDGLKIDFISEPFQRSSPRDVSMSGDMQAVCQAEICSLLKKGAIEEITDGSAGFLCSFFCVPKKNGWI